MGLSLHLADSMNVDGIFQLECHDRDSCHSCRFGTDQPQNFDPPTITVKAEVNSIIMLFDHDSVQYTATSISVSGGGPPLVSGILITGAAITATLTGPRTF